MAEACLNEEVSNFTTCFYDANIPTIHNPVVRYNAANPEDVLKLSIFIGLGGKSSGTKKFIMKKLERDLISSYILMSMEEVKPYRERFTRENWKLRRDPTPKESKDLFDNGGGFDKGCGFISWFAGLAKKDKEMKPELRNIAHGFIHSVNSFHSYDMNGYRFHTHEHTTNRGNRKTINSGVLCEGSDKLHYYGRVEAIYELNYGFGKGLDPVVFKCNWLDPRRIRRDPTIGLVEVERSSKYSGDDVYILATQAFQVFYLPYPCKKTAKAYQKRLQGWDVVVMVQSHSRPAMPNGQDYRRLDPSTSDGEFYQDGGLPGKFTINLPTDNDMEYGEEDEDAGMEEDTVHDEVEEVHNQADVTLLERFHAGLIVDKPRGPPPGSVDGWWCGDPDSDDDTGGPIVGPDDLDTGY